MNGVNQYQSSFIRCGRTHTELHTKVSATALLVTK